MAGSKVNAYAVGDVDLTSLMETVDRQRRGYIRLSLTNFATSLEPKIAAGSVVELSGALYSFGSDESITGWSGIANSTAVYIKLVPSGSSVTAEFTTTAPSWSDEKQGFYSTNDRYIGGLYKDGSGNYTEKWLYKTISEITGIFRVFGTGDLSLVGSSDVERTIHFASDAAMQWDENADEFYFNKSLKIAGGIETDGTKLKTKIIEIGDWDMDTTVQVTILHGLTLSKIKRVSAIVRDDAGTTFYITPHYDGSYMELYFGTLTLSVRIIRGNGSTFDSTDFDATGYNRGWITIEYEA